MASSTPATSRSTPRVSDHRLTHSDLDFCVDVTVHERDGRYMATADLGEDSRDVGVGDTPQEAVKAALSSLGEPCASEMVEGVARRDDRREERGSRRPPPLTSA